MRRLRTSLNDHSLRRDAEQLRVLLNTSPQPPGGTAGTWYRIWVIPNDGTTPTDYDVNTAGFTAAVAYAGTAGTGGMILVPPCTIANDHTIPAGYTVYCQGINKVIFTGTLTFSADSALVFGSINKSASSASAVVSAIGPAAGWVYLVSVTIYATNTGSGDAYAVQDGGGNIRVRDCVVLATADSGDAHGLHAAAGGLIEAYQGVNIKGLSASGEGYAVYNDGSTVTVEWSDLYAETAGVDSPPIGGAASATVVSAAGSGKALNLYSGGANADPPADWFENAFDDSAWSATVDGTAGWTPLFGDLVAARTTVEISDPANAGEKHLIRHTFNLAAVGTARFRFQIEDWLYNLYINGVLIAGNQTAGGAESGGYNPEEIWIDESLLVVGDNVLAIEFANGEGWAIGITYSLEILNGTTYVIGNEIENEFGAKSGYPYRGDRAAFNVTGFPERHANDLDESIYQHHVPKPEETGHVLYADSQKRWASGTAAEAGVGITHPLTLDTPTTLTISGGAVTVTTDNHVINAQSGNADDLDTISGSTNYQVLVLRASAGDTITVKHGTGNIYLNGETDFVMSGRAHLLLFYTGSYWTDFGSSGTGTGGEGGGGGFETGGATDEQPMSVTGSDTGGFEFWHVSGEGVKGNST